MKKNFYAGLMGLMAVCVISCQNENKEQEESEEQQKKELEEQLVTVGFEQVQLGEQGYADSTSYTESGIVFSNTYNSDYSSWYGFAVSSCIDSVTTGYLNMYSAAAGKSASGNQFAVAYYAAYIGDKSCNFKFSDGKEHKIKSMAIANSTYVYFDMFNGSAFSKKFDDGDYLVMTFTGLDAKGNIVGTLSHYLADFTNGNTKLSKEWETVDFTSLGAVNEVDITFDSSDKGSFGINTPTYACIDNIIYAE